MKLFYILLLFSTFCMAQITYNVEPFSKSIFATVTITDDSVDEVFKNGTIRVYDSKTKTEIISLESPEITFDINKNNDIKTNVKELPYGEQSILMYEDFNFDNQPDLALMNGQESCYHGPSYSVYLYSKGKYIYNDSFSGLASDNCGMFDVDYKTKRIITSTKSGCCWHQKSTYKVVNNSPIEIEIFEMDHTKFPFYTETTTTMIGKKTKVQSKFYIADDVYDVKQLLSFELEGNNKKVVLFEDGAQQLYYALLNKDKTVAFNYPEIQSSEKAFFTIDQSKKTISFTNKDTIYTIYCTQNTVGIIINQNQKITNLKGKFTSLCGSLASINIISYTNVK